MDGVLSVLRAFAPKDFSPMAALRRDVALQHHLLSYPQATQSDDDVWEWLARRQGDGIFMVIVDASDAAVGFVQLANIHRKGGCAMVGIALLPAARGHGFAKRAMDGIMEIGRGMGLRKIMTEVRVDNGDAITLYNRCRFSRAGRLKDHYVGEDGPVDVVVMERMLD